MNKRTSTLSELFQLLFLFVGVLWIYYMTEAHEMWYHDYANYARAPSEETFREDLWYMFHFSFGALFFVWPFTTACVLQLLVMLFHLAKDGNVIHYRTSRIAIILGLYIVGIGAVSPLIYVFAHNDKRMCVVILNGVFMGIYGTIMCSQLFLRLIWAAAEADNPAYKKRMARGGDTFDSWPECFNPDSQAVCAGGIPEPKADFVPPEDWIYQCQKCGARNEVVPSTCWFCHSTISPPVTPTVVQVTPPRMFTCHKCNRYVKENRYGDFEKGVKCPFCNAKIFAPPPAPVLAPVPSTAILRERRCWNCDKDVWETVAGSFEKGVICPYCNAMMYST